MEPKVDKLELQELKKDEVDKGEDQEKLILEQSDRQVSGECQDDSDSAKTICNDMWEKAFDNLAKADGENDGKIELRSLVKWIQSLDLTSKIEFEKNLEVSPNHVERILREVSIKISSYEG